jgi:syntaxin 16
MFKVNDLTPQYNDFVRTNISNISDIKLEIGMIKDTADVKIDSSLADVQKNTENIRKLMDQYIREFDQNKMNNIKTQIEELNSLSHKKLFTCFELIKSFDVNNPIQKNKYNIVLNKLKLATEKLNSMNITFVKDWKSDGKTLHEMFGFSDDSVSGQVQYDDAEVSSLLENAKSKHAEISKLVDSVSEINTLYNNLMIIINEQGVMVDNIVSNLGNTVEIVDKGNGELGGAIKIQKRKNCCFNIIMSIIIVIAVIFILTFMYYFK